MKSKKNKSKTNWNIYSLKKGQIVHINGIPIEIMKKTKVKSGTKIELI